ncbi:MAG: phosphoglucosamine mutase [Bdellovibrio sp.]|nr:MAG: phosphoglucosamine mutase [Bdellovibrio sp.]
MTKRKAKLFGTDGIRGTANTYPMVPEVVVKVGQALGYLLRQMPMRKETDKKTVLIGKDTRLSGYMLEQSLASGLNSMGIRVQLTGPLPTPGIGFVAQNMRADAGVVISASHNSFQDNGIKIFDHDGFKISDEMEREIERLVLEEDLSVYLVPPEEVGRTRRIDDAPGRYIVFVKSAFPLSLNLSGMRIVLDCANGAAYSVAPRIFEELGAEVIVMGVSPTGYNINDKCGAIYPEKVAAAVKKYRADVGISLDGDADRVVLVDELGQILNGDHVLAILALHMKQKGELLKGTVVVTEMSNIGLDHALKKHGIQVVRAPVGDKNVVDVMRKQQLILGGEQSGHIICLSHSTTGDGCVAALKVLAAMREQGKKLSELGALMKPVPQVLVNVRVKQKRPLHEIKGYQEFLESIQKNIGPQGRVFIRPSGTEPVIRVLVEGPDRHMISRYADEMAQFLQDKLGDL